MAKCPHGVEMNVDHTEILRFAGPIYTCACCHRHWGGFEGNPNDLHYCGSCKPPKNTTPGLHPTPERAREIVALHQEGLAKRPPGAATCSDTRLRLLPDISVGDEFRWEPPPKKTFWERLRCMIWPF